MKKLLLLIASGLFCIATNAQYTQMTVPDMPMSSFHESSPVKAAVRANLGQTNTAAKTTSAAPRWYSYTHWFDTSEIDAGGTIAFALPYLWKDTMAIMAYSGTPSWAHNRSVSLGMVIDPSFSGFNDTNYYRGQMRVTAADAYTVDSIRFFGLYGFNPAKTAVVDTLRVAFVYGDVSYGNGVSGPDVYLAKTGNPAVLVNYGVSAPDSMSTYRMHFDTNVVRTNGPTVVVRDIILDNSGSSPAWGDTLSTGEYYGIVGFPDVNIPAGNMIGASVTFISGDATFADHDTVFVATSSIAPAYRYNMFRPYVAYRGTTAGASFANYSATNRNSGLFKTLPDTANKWGGQYIPLWFWSASGGGAATNQYPYIDFHIKCNTCGSVNVKTVANENAAKIGAYPNPASAELIVPFELPKSSDVTITINNMIGQVVATKNIYNVSKGKAVFNTALLPPGIYVVSVSADGRSSTLRVAINK